MVSIRFITDMDTYTFLDNSIDKDNCDLSTSLKVNNLISTNISLTKIKLIEKQLNFSDVVSLLFLLNDTEDSLFEELLNCNDQISLNLISKWYKFNSTKNASNKILEGLFVIKNYKLLKLLGINKYDAVYNFTHSKSNLLPIKKILFNICDSLTKFETEKIVEEIKLKSDYQMLELYLIERILKNGKGERFDFKILIQSLLNIGKNNLAGLLTSVQIFEPEVNVSVYKKEKNEEIYPIINSNRVGLCMIINQENFIDGKLSRCGSLVDVKAIVNIMQYFKFDIVCTNKFYASELENIICDTIKSEFKDEHSMLFIYIMSHGEEGAVYGYDMKLVTIKQIKTAIHNSRILNGRPVVIIVQACQGQKNYSPIAIDGAGDIINDLRVASDGEKDSVASDLKDVMVCMTTVPGFSSFRHIEKGTFYIQTLCKMMKMYEGEDIYSIITRVQKVLTTPESFHHSNHKIAMLPEFYSRFVKKLYLKRNI